MKNIHALHYWCFAVLLIVPLLAGCGGGYSQGGGGSSSSQTGSASFSYSWSSLTLARTRAATQINSVVISVNGQKQLLMTPTTSVTFSGMPVGSLPYTITAYDQYSGSGTVLGTASGSVTVSAGKTTQVTVAGNLSSPAQVVVGVLATSAQVPVGSKLQMTAVGETSTGAVVLLSTNSFTWTSSNTAIATVDKNGLLTGVRAGQVSITATYANTIAQTQFVTVTGGTQPAVQEKIVFVSTRDGNHQLYLINPDGSGITHVLSSNTEDNAPTFDPTSQRIAFASYRNSNWDLYLINQDGSGLQQLTTTQEAEYAPAWSPDGKSLAFDVWQNGSVDSTNQGAPLLTNLEGINVLNVAAGTRSLLVNNAYGACWSPDGTQVAYTDTAHNNCISVINVSTHAVQQLTTPPGVNTLDIHPNWSHDGTLIVFERQVIAQIINTTTVVSSDIYLVSPSSYTLAQLTNTGKEHQPIWSPDGAHIAFSSTRDGNGNYEGYIMSAAGKNPWRLTMDNSLNIPYGWGRW